MPRPISHATTSGSPSRHPTGKDSPRRGRRGRIHCGPSNLAERAGAAAEPVHLEAQLLEHADEQVGKRLVVLAVEGTVPRVVEPAAGEDDRQIVAGGGRAVPHVAAIEYGRLLEKRLAAIAGPLQ